MKVYSRKRHRNIEIQVHFGVGNSVQTACGKHLFSRHIMVELGSYSDGAVITDDIAKVTCKRCLITPESRLRKLLAIESQSPGVFDRPLLCGQDWILNHALDVTQATVNALKLEVKTDKRSVTVTAGMKAKDVKTVLRSIK